MYVIRGGGLVMRENLGKSPALELRNRAGFLDSYPVPDSRLAILIVRVEFFRPFDDLLD